MWEAAAEEKGKARGGKVRPPEEARGGGKEERQEEGRAGGRR